MAAFAPTFNVSWDAPKAEPERPKPQPKLDAFGVDEAFASFKPSFSTEAKKTELIMPKAVPPVDELSNTAAARIFGEFCQEKFGFKPDFEQK